MVRNGISSLFFAIALLLGICGECATGTGTVATWTDNATGLPYYSIYDGTSWSTLGAISTTTPSSGNVFTAYDSSNKTTMATWINAGNGYYAIYQNGAWGTAAQIPGVSPQSDVSVVFDAPTGQFMACWADLSAHANVAFYSSGSWGSTTVITTSFSVYNNVYAAFDTAGNGIATWRTTTTPNQAIYAIYYNGSWTAAGEITAPNNSIGVDVYVSYNEAVGFVATWAAGNAVDLMGATGDIVSGNVNWTVDTFATFAGNHNVSGDMGSSYNPILNETIVAFSENGPTGVIYYAINSGGTWGSALPSGLATSHNVSVYTTYDANTQTTLAVFPDISLPGNPYYATYDGTSWIASPITTTSLATDWIFAGPIEFGSSGPIETMNLTGARQVNDFGTLREYYDVLIWTAYAGDVSSYLILANGVTVGSIPSSQLTYDAHNQSKNGSVVYLVEAVDASENILSSATVTIN